MTKEQAQRLNASLNAEGLKVKFLSADQYVKLLGVKRPLSRYIEEVAKDEKELFEGYDITIFNGMLNPNDVLEKSKDKTFREKLKAIYKDFEPKELNFIPQDEFNKFTADVDFGTASVLAEYLLKES